MWDIENVRLPSNMSVTSVIHAVKRAFVTSAGFSEHASVCCVTPVSLRAMIRHRAGFVHETVPLMDIRVASESRSKLGADFVLRRELGKFMDGFAKRATSCRIVLLTGDVDFLEPVQRALGLGFDVQLVHFGRNASRLLVDQRYAARSPPVEWERFLTDANGGTAVDLPYDDDAAAAAAHAQPMTTNRLEENRNRILMNKSRKKRKHQTARRIAAAIVNRKHWARYVGLSALVLCLLRSTAVAF